MDINKIFEELVKKVSRKGRLILIGIVALLFIKQPETITWSNGFLNIFMIASIVWLVTYGTWCQFKFDMKYGEKPEPDYNPDIPDSEQNLELKKPS